MTKIAKAKAKTNETYIVQAPLKIVTYDRQNMFIVQATVLGERGCWMVCILVVVEWTAAITGDHVGT